MSEGPLAGLRVLDLSQGVTGPFATKYYADFGADVVKVERPDGGDPARRMGPFPHDVPHAETSGMFLHLNTGKRSVTLDLRHATARAILLRLVADADLVVESFRPGTLGRLGVGPEAIAAANPRAALLQISNFGQSGPYRDFAADDLLLYAMGGVMQITGDPEREPIKLGLYMPLFFAGVVAAGMGLAAAWGARRDGVGERVDCSIQEALAASMDRGAPNLMAYQYSGTLMSTRERAVRMNALPAGTYPVADGYVSIATQIAWWPRLCRTIGRPDLIDDERIASRLYDPLLAEEIDALVYPWLLSHTKQEAMALAQAEGWPVSALNTMDDVFRDPHFRARNFFTTLDHPYAGALEYPGFALKLHGTPGTLHRAPLLGEHTVEVLCGVGYARADVVRLRQLGVV
ncbi:MAG: CoA transferase [Chloroflexi bacterium]|nr:CoA transferase [Chloroflexota bacterium]